jgi:hypothetical protein
MPRYVRDKWCPDKAKIFNVGTYVVATKYADGDPGDEFCVGFYNGFYNHCGQTRHLIVDDKGLNFRANGFRLARRVGPKRGSWMVKHLSLIESMKDRFSVWHWYNATWKELQSYKD